jgi:predicted DNA-binding transcriptional regulator AlpA
MPRSRVDLQQVLERLAKLESSAAHGGGGGGAAALPELLNVQDLAKLLRTSPNAVRVMSCRGQLPEPLRLPGSKRLLWSASDVAQWLNEAKSRPESSRPQ